MGRWRASEARAVRMVLERAQRGDARARSTLWLTPDHRLAFVVQVSAAGARPIVEQDRLEDARRGRETIRVSSYELVRLPSLRTRLQPGPGGYRPCTGQD